MTVKELIVLLLETPLDSDVFVVAPGEDDNFFVVARPRLGGTFFEVRI